MRTTAGLARQLSYITFRWENGQQKLQWELATARNALKFKKQVESGLCVPEEERKKLEEKTNLSKEEEGVLRQAAELSKRRKKLHWLKTEQQMVDLHLAIRTSLSSSNPLIPRCISHITALLALPMQPLMLKKQPEIVDTLRSLRYNPSSESLHIKFHQNTWIKYLLSCANLSWCKFSENMSALQIKVGTVQQKELK